MNFLKNYKNILCFFSHPDDETLGAGGLLSVASDNKIRKILIMHYHYLKSQRIGLYLENFLTI